ncbi:hypothetical protein QFC21_002417 [Naganishia friedmannii]|uniref:Uncharacterized protein n=1 Tax=Naganishia friedmannii TaxID=89922 RepID=A0ACC2VY15_9TREE|nr:hypothetical protein QFC21_002417 [Naganishia friedmannii]
MHEAEKSGQTVASMAPPKKKLSKADIGHQLGAFLLIDDSIENALDCATHHPALPVLLFGPYPWNRHVTKEDSPEDVAAHEERMARGIDSEEGETLAGKLKWSGEDVGQALPSCVHRVKDWTQVVDFVRSKGTA